MKKTLFFLILLCFACEKDRTLSFETVSYTNDGCKGCPDISIVLPKTTEKSKLGSVIDDELSQKVIDLMAFDEEGKPSTIGTAIESFNTEYKELKEQFPQELNNWEAKVDGKVVYNSPKVVTVQLDSYLFTGGAHGYGSTEYVNFDTVKSKVLGMDAIFKDMGGFTAFAEDQFRKQEHIPSDKNINSTGFMFSEDVFQLPENMGFTERGLLLIYNQYEVASYADGPIELLFPYGEISKFLAIDPEQPLYYTQGPSQCQDRA